MFSFTRILAVIALAQVALSIPITIKYDEAPSGDVTRANKQRIDDATTLANNQIGNMQRALKEVGKGNKKAIALYEAAFGKDGKNSDINNVKDTVKSLENEAVDVKLKAHGFKNGEIAAVPWKQDKKGDPWEPGPVRLSKQFHNDLDDNGRAATLIHEATHQLKDTGDHVHKKSRNILDAQEDDSDKDSKATGYTSNVNMHKTIVEVEADKQFASVRNKANNMHDNAESYAVFASLCTHNAFRRRDLALFRRALVEGDEEQLEYLARRNSCTLPPDYFAKKAAAKKAKEEADRNAAKSPEATTMGHENQKPLSPQPAADLKSKKSASTKPKAPHVSSPSKDSPTKKTNVRPNTKVHADTKASKANSSTRSATKAKTDHTSLKSTKGRVASVKGNTHSPPNVKPAAHGATMAKTSPGAPKGNSKTDRTTPASAKAHAPVKAKTQAHPKAATSKPKVVAKVASKSSPSKVAPKPAAKPKVAPQSSKGKKH